MKQLFVRIKVLYTTALFLLFATFSGQTAASPPGGLARAFASPPQDAQPDVIWYWRHENQSREAVTADLEAMRRVGIGGVLIGFIGGGDEPKGNVTIMSTAWREVVKHAFSEAQRLGMRVSMFNSPGWSSTGGPWVPPEMAMQRVAWTETRVCGGATVIKCPAPLGTPTAGLANKLNLTYYESIKQPWYRDIAVVAFPTPVAEAAGDGAPVVMGMDRKNVSAQLIDGNELSCATITNPKPGEFVSFTFTYEHSFLPGSLAVIPKTDFEGVKTVKLERSDDGVAWSQVFLLPTRRSFPTVSPVTGVKATRFWRLSLASDAKGPGAFALAELSLSPGYRIRDWSAKSMRDSWGMSKPPFSDPAVAAPEAAAIIAADQIQILTDRLKPDGTLSWNPPPGNWTVLRFGTILTLQVNGPATPSGMGLEIDKYNPAAVDLHWNRFIAPLIADPVAGKALSFLHIDSYEKGSQNWSPVLPQEFRNRRGYDLIPLLPVLTGRVIGNLQHSERFLWDFRKTLCDSMADNYYGRFAKLCHQHGRLLSVEPYNQVAFDNVVVGGRGDQVMSEFWHGGLPGKGYFKNAASPAHLYGKRLVTAEAFTAPPEFGGNFSTAPWDLKIGGDRAYSSGINRFVFHVSNQQPWLDLRPGVVGRWGQHLNRNNTWFDLSYGWLRYLARCQYLLQQGHYVGDLIASTGENSPCETGWTARKLPPGYDFDNASPEVILTRLRCQNGTFLFPMADGDGLASVYSAILVLPEDPAMTVVMANKVRELVLSGATVVGQRPIYSPTLANQPNEDKQFAAVVRELWGDGTGTVQRTIGQGRVIAGQSIDKVLEILKLAPDFSGPRGLEYHHRQVGGTDIYFVSNQTDNPVNGECIFRCAGRQPELWDPMDGTIRKLGTFRADERSTTVSLRFDSRQSYFIVFGGSSPALHASAQPDFMQVSPFIECKGSWEVSFDPKWGGPTAAESLPGKAGTLRFEALQDWTQRPEEGIRYYSGKATYRKIISLAPLAGQRLFIQLGTVKNIAEVHLNGVNLGCVWCAPWRVEITSSGKNGENLLEITVANLWVNRLIGDENRPEDTPYGPFNNGLALLTDWPDWLVKGMPRTSGRYTFSTAKHWRKGDPLQPSGLIGPVTIQNIEERRNK